MSEPIRVVIIEDDADVAMFVKTVLEKKDRCVVHAVDNPHVVLEAVEQFEPDVVITDIELPGMSGLDLITGIRALRPGIPVLVMTAHASVDHAVTALRNQADEFVTKPVTSSALIDHVERMAALAQERAAARHEPEVVVAIGAHPDDVEFGVGGILAGHAAKGDQVVILTLSRGDREGGVRQAWAECSAAAAVIGAQAMFEDIPQPLHRTGQLHDTITKVITEFAPTVVYLPSKSDSDPDHLDVHFATLVAATGARTIACYQSSSATVDFRPNRFVTIDGHTDTKLRMLEAFGGDARPEYLEPDYVLATARAWSRFGQGRYCEPLEILSESREVG